MKNQSAGSIVLALSLVVIFHNGAFAADVLITKIAMSSCPKGVFSSELPCFGNAGNDSQVSAINQVIAACENIGGQSTRISCDHASYTGIDNVSYAYGSACATVCQIK